MVDGLRSFAMKKTHQRACMRVCVCARAIRQMCNVSMLMRQTTRAFATKTLSVLHKYGRRRRYLSRSFWDIACKVDFTFAQCPIQNQMDHMLR